MGSRKGFSLYSTFDFSQKNAKPPFPTEQCEGCAYWRPLSVSLPGMLKACHHTFFTGKVRHSDPPECDAFADKNGPVVVAKNSEGIYSSCD